MLIKKLFKAIFVLAGLALGVCAIGLAVMMVGHIKIFGIQFVSDKSGGVDLKREYTQDEVNRLNTVDVSTSKIKVVFQYATESSVKTMTLITIPNMQGFVKDDENGNAVTKVSYKFNPVIDSSGVLKVETIEPNGWMFNNSSYMKIVVPQGKVINVVVDTASSGVNIGNKDNFTVNNLSITASKRLLNASNASVTIGEKVTINGKLKLNTNYGRIIIKSAINGDVEINSKAGSIQIASSIGGSAVISGENPLVSFGSIPGGWAKKKTITQDDLNKLNKVNINGDLTIRNVTYGGNVKVSGRVGGLTYITAENIEFWANELRGGLNCDSGVNNIKVFGSFGTSASSSFTIDSGNGGLFINKLNSQLTVLANKGDVYIANANANVYIQAEHSYIYVGLVSGSTAKVTAKTTYGNIEVNNISNKVDLKTENGSIKAKFLKVIGENKIVSKRSIDVKVKDDPNNPSFTLTTKAKAGSVNVKMTPVVYTNWNGATEVDGFKTRTDIINGTTANSNSLYLEMTGTDRISAVLYAEE